MQDHQISLIEDSFAEVFAAKDDAAALFYERLFVLDPALRRLFHTADMAAQGDKLMQALAQVVGSLRALDATVPVLETLAVRHVGYGVKDAHYAEVGTALIETLSLYFGRRFTPELRAAWTEAYGIVAGVMRAAAAKATANAPVGQGGPARPHAVAAAPDRG